MLASSFLDCAGQNMSLSSKVREELRNDDGNLRVVAEVVEAPETRLFIRGPFVPLRNYMYVGCLLRLEDLGPRVGGQYGESDAHDSCTLMPSISIRYSVPEWSLVRKGSMG